MDDGGVDRPPVDVPLLDESAYRPDVERGESGQEGRQWGAEQSGVCLLGGAPGVARARRTPDGGNEQGARFLPPGRDQAAHPVFSRRARIGFQGVPRTR